MILLTSPLPVEGEQWPHTNELYASGYQRQPSLLLSVVVVATIDHMIRMWVACDNIMQQYHHVQVMHSDLIGYHQVDNFSVWRLFIDDLALLDVH